MFLDKLWETKTSIIDRWIVWENWGKYPCFILEAQPLEDKGPTGFISEWTMNLLNSISWAFLNFNIADSLHGLFSVHCKISSDIPCFHSPDASGISLLAKPTISTGTDKCSLGSKIVFEKNHCTYMGSDIVFSKLGQEASEKL